MKTYAIARLASAKKGSLYKMSEATRLALWSRSVRGQRRYRKRRPEQRGEHYCSICTSYIWSEPIVVVEPEGVPEPRLTWHLCKPCYQELQIQLARSPVHSPLRVRIAMGLVAAERWPHAYATRVRDYVNDRRWIVLMAVVFIIAMLVHLMLIVMIAALH